MPVVFAYFCSRGIRLSELAIPITRIAKELAKEFTNSSLKVECCVKEEEFLRELPADVSAQQRYLAELDESGIDQLYLFSPAHENSGRRNDFYIELSKEGVLADFATIIVYWFIDEMSTLDSAWHRAFVLRVILSLGALVELEYGLVEPMSLHDDEGLSFFHGIFTNNLSHEQALDLATWQKYAKQRQEKVRGWYWGNILGRKHAKRLSECLGEDDDRLPLLFEGNWHVLGANSLIAVLGQNVIDDTNVINLKHKLLTCGVLMHPDADIESRVSLLWSQRHR